MGVSKPSMTDNTQPNQELNTEAAAPPTATSVAAPDAPPSDVSAVAEAAVDDNNAAAAEAEAEAAAPPADATQNEQDNIADIMKEATSELDRLTKKTEADAALVKQLQDQLKQKEEISQKQAKELKAKQDREIETRRTDLKARLAALKQTEQVSNQVGMVEASAIVSDKMDIDQSEHIVNALEKATEGYIAASDSKKQLQQQLSDMSSAVGIVADAQRDNNKVADGSNKRKAEDIVDPAALAAQGTVNASADGSGSAAAAPANGLPMHTSEFMAGKISYDELSRACEAQRDAESGMRVRQLSGSVNASADAAAAPSLGLGIMGGFSASAHTAYSQYCNTDARRLLPAASEMRQDCRGMGLKQVFPGIWDEFMQINNSFEKTGVPNYVKGAICCSLNSYEHKRRNGESRLEMNDVMPPPPGGNVKPRQNREIEH